MHALYTPRRLESDVSDLKADSPLKGDTCMRARQSLEQWIHQCCADTQRGVCHQIVILHHANGGLHGGTPMEIDKLLLDGTLSIKQLAERFEYRVNDYVHDMSGTQQCEALAFYRDANGDVDQDNPVRRPFQKTTSPDYASIVASEPPNEKGLVMQSMRHHENNWGLMFGERKVLTEEWMAISAIQTEMRQSILVENARLRAENADSYDIIRDMSLRMKNEQIERDERLVKAQRAADIQAKVLQWAPALINTIAGKKVFPEATEDTAIIEGLLSSLEPSHIQMLLAMLPGPIQGLVSARASEIFKRREAKELQRDEAKQLTTGISTVEAELQ